MQFQIFYIYVILYKILIFMPIIKFISHITDTNEHIYAIYM